MFWSSLDYLASLKHDGHGIEPSFSSITANSANCWKWFWHYLAKIKRFNFVHRLTITIALLWCHLLPMLRNLAKMMEKVRDMLKLKKPYTKTPGVDEKIN